MAGFSQPHINFRFIFKEDFMSHSQSIQLKRSHLALAVTLACVSSSAFSAGMDRSRQDIKAFFNEGTYAEATVITVKTDISGYQNDATATDMSTGTPEIHKVASSDDKDYVKGDKIENITKDPYTFVRYGVKADVNDNVSVGIFYDEPWGANVSHQQGKGKSNFVSDPNQKVLVSDANSNDLQTDIIADMKDVNPHVTQEDYIANTNVSVHTQTWTGLVGYKKNGFQVYGGPVLQKAKAELHLRGNAYGPLTGYDAIANSDTAMGWAAGVAYSKPEIKLNAALTYHSSIEHELPMSERIPILKDYKILGDDNFKFDGYAKAKLGLTDLPTEDTLKKMKVKTPESININLQSGLSAKHQLLGMLDVRWVPWSKMELVPPSYNTITKMNKGDEKEGLPILSYDKDQWTVEAGIAKRFNDKLAGSLQVGWDSGAGDPVSSLGPVNGYYSVGGGLKYNVTPEWALSAGAKYLMFGDATAELPNGKVVGKFEDNDGFVAGVKVSYQSVD